MRRILVYYSQLNIGGAEKSLIRLMNSFVAAGDDVTYLGRYGMGKGEYLLDSRIHKITLSHRPPLSGHSVRALAANAICLLQRWFSLVTLKLRRLDYDLALIGLQGLSPEIVCKYTRSRRIAVFIRTDVSRIKDNGRVIQTLRGHESEVDNYICVAQSVRDALVSVLPETERKAIVIYNLLDVEGMKRNLAVADNPFEKEDDDAFRIISVCRISDASKGVFRMVRVCRKLVDEGFAFRWYIVGDGPDLPRLRQVITENGLDKVILTPGRIDNPFGYYRECDLVALLSYYEGLCGVVNEAKVAGKAIIATEVSGVREQLTHGVNGWIVKNDEDHILEGMRYLLSHKDVVEVLTNDIYPEAILDDLGKINAFHGLIERAE